MEQSNSSSKMMQRMDDALCKEKLDETSLDLLQRLLYNHNHLNADVVKHLGWDAIYCDNSGQLFQEEIQILLRFIQIRSIETVYATPSAEIFLASYGKFSTLKLQHITEDDFLFLQDTYLAFSFGQEPERANFGCALGWGSGLYFPVPLEFIVLRTRDGFGYKTIAGPKMLIAEIKNIKSYLSLDEDLENPVWLDGVPPIGLPF